ncbi:sodium/proline symporter [Parvularcula marina]|uniref:sodium/proline symporter n=1 Tax=Parvularcula marina TaxID=2292771 RepID=UPI003512CB56
MSENLTTLLFLVFFNVVLLGIGFFAYRRVKDNSDFILGGAKLGPFVSGLSYAASTSSVWVLLGYSGYVYAVGLSALWLLPGIWGGYVAVWLGLGKKLNDETRAQGHLTLTNYISHGQPRRAHALIAAIATLLIVFCFTFYVASQLQGAGRTFETYFDWKFGYSVLIGVVVVLFYSLLGGFWAVSLTDTIQGLFMAAISLAAPIAALIAVGGPVSLLSALPEAAPAGFLNATGGYQGLTLILFVVGSISIGLGTLGQPHLLNRLMALRDDKARKQGFAIAFGWSIAVYLGMTLLALCGRVLLPSLETSETLLFQISADYMPGIMSGVVMAAILSAIMSTVDSQLLVVSSSITHDMQLERIAPRHAVLVSRIVMILVAGLAVVLTFLAPDTIFQRVLFAWTALGAAFGPIVVARVIGFEHGPATVMAAMVVGFGSAVTFFLLPNTPGDIAERLLPWCFSIVILMAGAKRSASKR